MVIFKAISGFIEAYVRYRQVFAVVVQNFSTLAKYSQTSVFEHDSFWKAVQEPICSKTESYFPITNNVKEINSLHVPKE